MLVSLSQLLRIEFDCETHGLSVFQGSRYCIPIMNEIPLTPPDPNRPIVAAIDREFSYITIELIRCVRYNGLPFWMFDIIQRPAATPLIQAIDRIDNMGWRCDVNTSYLQNRSLRIYERVGINAEQIAWRLYDDFYRRSERTSDTISRDLSTSNLIKQPKTCIGCKYYSGTNYGGNKLICGVNPSGVDGDTCPDFA